MTISDKKAQTAESAESSSDVIFSIVIKTVITVVVSGGLFWLIK